MSSVNLIPADGVDAVAPRAKRTVLSEAAGLVALSVLSPVAGLAVEMVLAWKFGASYVVDAYRVAVLMVVYGQQIFVTAILPYVIVPVFSQYRAEDREQQAWVAADSIARVLLILGTLIALTLFVFPAGIAGILAPGLAGPGKALTVFFIRWCGLTFIPLCWSGIACGILYAHHVFRVAPVCQFIANIVIVVAILAGADSLGPACVVWGVVLGTAGSAALYAFQVAAVRRASGARRTKGIDFGALRAMLKLAAPMAAGIVVGQATGAVITRSLSRLAVGSLAVFGYAGKLGNMVTLAPAALSTVLFPRLADSWHSESAEDFQRGYVKALRSVFFVSVLLTLIAFTGRRSIVALILERGQFSPTAGENTAAIFGLLILAAPGAAVSTYLDRMFYATKGSVQVLWVDVLCSLLAVTLVPFCAARFGTLGAASVFMLMPWANCCFQVAFFQYRHRNFPFGQMTLFAFQILGAGVVAFWAGQSASRIPVPFASPRIVSLLLGIGAGTAVAASVFTAATALLRLPEPLAFANALNGVVRSTLARLRQVMNSDRDRPLPAR